MDTLTQQIFFMIIKMNNFWGDLSGISAKTATLDCRSLVAIAPDHIQASLQTVILDNTCNREQSKHVCEPLEEIQALQGK